MIGPRWGHLFVQHQVEVREPAWAFWSHVTGHALSPRRGERGEFASLVPPTGDGWLKLQAVEERRDPVHVDLAVDDVRAATAGAVRLGAVETGAIDDVVRILRSPGGFTFCLTSWQNEGRPSVQTRDAEEVVDQVCLDIPADRYDAELVFWAELTGWELGGSPRPEFRWLRIPDGFPLRVLLQRLDDAPTGEAGVVGHPDVACVDRAAVARRHVDAGASVVAEYPWWTVLRDPGGLTYCLTSRHPRDGSIPGIDPALTS